MSNLSKFINSKKLISSIHTNTGIKNDVEFKTVSTKKEILDAFKSGYYSLIVIDPSVEEIYVLYSYLTSGRLSKSRKVHTLVTFDKNGEVLTKEYDFDITKSVKKLPIRKTSKLYLQSGKELSNTRERDDIDEANDILYKFTSNLLNKKETVQKVIDKYIKYAKSKLSTSDDDALTNFYEVMQKLKSIREQLFNGQHNIHHTISDWLFSTIKYPYPIQSFGSYAHVGRGIEMYAEKNKKSIDEIHNDFIKWYFSENIIPLVRNL